MASGAYYNEHDPIAAEWLRNLIAAGLIAAGEVDERDIRDVTPIELRGFVQCHFFAGIGIWSHAARRSGWPDDRPLWTGSCPCQPFSDAGRGDGVADERHLWPHWQWLIAHERPPVVVGEQVASKDGLGWLDLVSADMEGAGYAFGAADLCAAGFGLDWRDSAWREWLQRAIRHCPDPMVAGWIRHYADWADQSLIVGGQHIRQRLYFVGLADDPRRGCGIGGHETRAGQGRHLDSGGDPVGRLGDAQGTRAGARLRDQGEGRGRAQHPDPGAVGGLADSPGIGREMAVLDERGGGATAGIGQADVDRGGGAPEQLGDPAGARSQGLAERRAARSRSQGPAAQRAGKAGGLGDTDSRGGEGHARAVAKPEIASEGERLADRSRRIADLSASPVDGVGDTQHMRRDQGVAGNAGSAEGQGGQRGHEPDRSGGDDRPSETDSRRAPFDWVFCRDGCWRPVESGSSPLAHAVAGRVGKLRSIGNGLDAETATSFMCVVGELVEETFGHA